MCQNKFKFILHFSFKTKILKLEISKSFDMIQKQKKLMKKLEEKSQFLKKVKSLKAEKENYNLKLELGQKNNSIEKIISKLDEDSLLSGKISLSQNKENFEPKEIENSNLKEILQEFIESSRIRSKDSAIQKSVPFFEILKGTFIENCSNKLGSDFLGSTILKADMVQNIMSLTHENEILYKKLQMDLDSGRKL